MSTIQINGVVHQRQLNKRACWFTSLQMAVRYFENKSQSSNPNLVSPEFFPDMKDRFDKGSNPSWAEWRQWGEKCGFTALNMTPNEMGVYQTISRYGPIIYSGTWGNTFDGHVVILTGINTDSKVLTMDDPWEATAPITKDIYAYFSQLSQTLWENPLFVFEG